MPSTEATALGLVVLGALGGCCWDRWLHGSPAAYWRRAAVVRHRLHRGGVRALGSDADLLAGCLVTAAGSQSAASTGVPRTHIRCEC